MFVAYPGIFLAWTLARARIVASVATFKQNIIRIFFSVGYKAIKVTEGSYREW